MSKTQTTTRTKAIDLSEDEGVRKFLEQRARKVADEIINYVGVINIHTDEFDQAVEDAFDATIVERRLAWNRKFYPDAHGPLVGDALEAERELEEINADELIYHSRVMYLLGLAVGRQIGGAR